jgi:acetyltransferase
VYDALLIQSGVQRVDTIAELFDYAALYTTQPLPHGNRVAIITNAGGPGIMATDATVRNGLKLADLTTATMDKLRGSLPPTASLRNPVDVIGDARHDRYKAAVRTVLEDPNVDMGMVILTPQSMTEIEETAQVVPEACKGINKPVVCSFMGARDVAPGAKILREAGVPNYPFPEDGVRALAAADRLVRLREISHREIVEFDDLDVDAARKIIRDALEGKQEQYLSQADCRPLLAAYKLPLLKSAVVGTADEAARTAELFGTPVAMKVMSAEVVHKYDAGGVLLNLQGPQQAREAFETIRRNVLTRVPHAKISGMLVEEMARKGVEVILGASRDPRFGPLMMFGLGGTLVEVLKDVSFRLAPMWEVSAEKMVREIHSFKLLDGFRGTPKSDVDAIVDCLLRLSAMVCNHPEIAELDINPLIVHPKGQGCSVADSRVMLRQPK